MDELKSFSYKRIGLITVLSMSAVLSGCNLIGGGAQKSEEKSALKVMYYDERSFYSQLGMVYSALHPEVDITVVTNQQSGPYDPQKDMKAEFDKFIDEKQPDVLMLTPEQLTEYAEDGKLLELDTMTEEKTYNKETLIPGLLDYMKELGGGKIYGLSSSFYSQAIFYNKDLFNKYGIPLPEDRMSWDKLFELAQRFPTDGAKDKRVYGLSLGYNGELYQLGSMIGASQNLSMVNAASKQVTINSPAWKNVFQTAMNGLKSGALYTEDPNGMNTSSQTYEDYLLRDPFIAGKVAMKLEGAYFIGQIKESQTRVKDKAIKSWDIVTVPVDPQSPDSSPNMSFNQIFAVNAKSVNTEAAKEFIRYVTSDEYARVTSKLQDGSFPVRTNYIKDDDNHNMKAFYSLKPAKSSIYKDYDKLPQNFFMQFMNIAQEELKSAFAGKKSLDDALATAQTKGQQIMVQEQAKQKDKPAEAAVTEKTASGTN
ncbi:extracellular solute-binding protein [Paenibacillus sp. sptzw28]|uniref:ABC transporter substrate-binding protein n=1 Tax=Paenibacillus sp. sptzw28 TaxID=715179 RepID=UPI001C6E6524|nr:extracellular solute-binding protein [Paenibacillus sp. sptzw28]QYR20656.1 extracellular solute-binding protein [Paenibacillus sp. sptzw28]